MRYVYYPNFIYYNHVWTTQPEKKDPRVGRLPLRLLILLGRINLTLLTSYSEIA